ncbi:MAG: hypothetical protein QOF68_1972 [Gaiellales bacterium]|nr:hypothetical protein [Gaiellales bacterium]
MATVRLRQLLAALAVTLSMVLLSAGPAFATAIRVEAPKDTVFQGSVTPFKGTLQGKKTTKNTALGALVTASRTKPFKIGLQYNDSFGAGWAGFFLDSITGIAGTSSAFWAVKVDQKLTSVGIGAAVVTPSSKVLIYYTTFDPVTFATKPTLGITASDRKVKGGGSVTFSVKAYDDAGTATTAGGAWVWVNGVASKADSNGDVTVRLSKGRYSVRATATGTIRSKSMWVQAG